MNILIKHVQYLLRYNECVILPGFGAFICHTVPALIDKKKGIVINPFRYISFNSDIKSNDGLLIESVARGESIAFETASIRINEEIDLIKSTIEKLGFFMFPRIGRIIRKKNNFEFVPDKDSSLYNPYMVYGEDENLNDQETQKSSVWNHISSLVKIAAMITVITSIAYLFLEPIKDGSAFIKASLMPQYEKNTRIEYVFEEIPDFDGVLTIGAASVEPIIKEDAVKAIPQKTYGIIIASFDTEQQANAYIKQYNNEGLNWILKDNHYRVYVETSQSKEEAIEISISEKIKQKWGSAWVTRLR